MARAKKDGFLPADTPDDYEGMRKFVEGVERGEYRIDTLPSMHVPMEMQTFDKILPLIFNRKWMLFKAPPNVTGFITSDHPTCLRWDDPPSAADCCLPASVTPKLNYFSLSRMS